MYGRDPALDDFVRQMDQLRRQVGGLPLSRLRQLSIQVYQRNPRTRRELAESTLSDLFSRKGIRWPSWPLVATFVEACHLAAEEEGMEVAELGSLQEWKERLQAASAHQPYTTAEQPETETTEDTYRLGLLLCCDGRVSDGKGHLRRAAAAGHHEALELYHHPNPVGAAGRAAYRIGRAYDRAGKPSLAKLFYRAAAKTRLTEALLRLDPAELGQTFTSMADEDRNGSDAYGFEE